MYGRAFHCVRCGEPAYDDRTGHCDKCEAEYQAELRADYEAGQPSPVVVGRAFGAELAIWVHEDKEHCGCRGGGWHYTELDSIHECPIKAHAGPHPEY